MTKHFYRYMAGAAVLVSLLFLPWWTTALIVLIFAFSFDWYFEAIAAGFAMDALYGIERIPYHGVDFLATIAGALVFFAAVYAKDKLRYYT